MTVSKILDTSVWISYLFEGKCKHEIEGNEQLFLSVLSLFEIKAKLLKRKVEYREVKDKINFVKKKSIILSVDEKTAEMAAELSAEKNLPAMDSMIYASAMKNNLELITLDNDFKGLEKARVLS